MGIRAKKPNAIWHLDVTVLRLLDGTRLYLHGVVDNFSRRVLAWRLAAVRRLVTFYVKAFNEAMPHSALNGRTPDEVYFGKGEDIPVKLAAARQAARARRLTEKRAVTCETCTATSEPTTALENAA